MFRRSLFYLQKRPFSKFVNSQSVVDAYTERVKKGIIKEDPHQRLVIQSLEDLRKEILQEHDNWLEYSSALKDYVQKKIQYQKENATAAKPVATQGSGGFFGGFFQQAPTRSEGTKPQKPVSRGKKIKGLYVYGGPGCGKTYTMDIFSDIVPIQEKMRIHFNEFMLKVHDDLHKIDHKVHMNPLTIVAQNIASKTRLLCFDEFQVTDIADALIMKGLFQSLFINNVVLMATSNRPPEDLYYRGLQRHLFVPFIDILKNECKVINMNSPIDYRVTFESEEALKASTFIEPANRENNKKLDRIFKSLSGHDDGTPMKLQVMSGREIQIPKVANGVAMFDFLELCDKSYGSMDFIAICRNFHSVLLKNLPEISLNNKNLTRRFILLVDELYNHKVKLYVTAAKPLNELVKLHSDDGPSDELFALDRTKSRLIEMQSTKYMEEPSYYKVKQAGGHFETAVASPSL